MIHSLLLASFLLFPLSHAAEPLYTISEEDVSEEKACPKSEDVLSCRKIDVNFDPLEDMADILIPEVDVVLSFHNLTVEGKFDKALNYENDAGDSAILDMSKKKGPIKKKGKRKQKRVPLYLEASIHVEGRIFEIASCRDNGWGNGWGNGRGNGRGKGKGRGKGNGWGNGRGNGRGKGRGKGKGNDKGRERCHVLIEFDPSKFVDETGVEEEMPVVLPGSNRSLPIADAALDKSAESNLQVKIYYTQQLLNSFQSKDAFKAFINLAFSECNAGYSESGVNLQAELHSMELSSVPENNDLSTQLSAFKNSKASNCLLRDGADVALLMTLNGNYCGVAYTDVIASGQTLGVVKKSCATGYYSFGHEIAHMAGALHNHEQSGSVPSGSYNYGELIRTPSGEPSGYRTIMAYAKDGFATRVNRYSSASDTFKGNPLGTATEDNVRLLNENAASFAAVGETVTCSSSSSSCKDSGWNGFECHQFHPSSCLISWFAENFCPITCGLC